jgi:hypothetical protein
MVYLVNYDREGFYTISSSVLAWQFDLLKSIGRCRAYYKEIRPLLGNIEDERIKNYATHTCNKMFLSFIIDWCKIFGSENNKTHWKKLFKKHYTTDGTLICKEDAYINKVESVIFAECGMDLDGFKRAKKKMVKARNKFAAHVDIGEIPEMPYMDVPYGIAQAFCIFLSHIEGDNFETLDDLADMFEGEAMAFLRALNLEQ